MLRKEKRMVSQEVVVGVQCDVCGFDIENNQYATLSAYWGYESPWDFEYHEAHICVECYRKLPFFSRIRKYEYMVGGEILGEIEDED